MIIPQPDGDVHRKVWLVSAIGRLNAPYINGLYGAFWGNRKAGKAVPFSPKTSAPAAFNDIKWRHQWL